MTLIVNPEELKTLFDKPTIKIEDIDVILSINGKDTNIVKSDFIKV